MRMWMVNPKILCNKHLLGEHVEMHMFLGTFKQKKSIKGYINNNLVEPLKLKERHDLLVKEMERRGMHHKSILNINDELNYLSNNDINSLVNVHSSLEDLIGRCEECKKNYMMLMCNNS